LDEFLFRCNTYLDGRLNSNLNGQPAQLLLFEHYRTLKADPSSLPRIEDVGFSAFSQADEDGLLLYVLALIGMGSKRCVEIGYGRPRGANTTNLIVNWGFDGLGLDGSEEDVDFSARWFRRHPIHVVSHRPPRILHEWVSPENVNDLLEREGFVDEIDVVSIDIDGFDYWVWDALEAAHPRVMVVEFNELWPADVAVTVPNDPAFATARRPIRAFNGASLRAFEKLASRRGYRLVACNRGRWNAIFVLDSLAPEYLPAVSVERCLAFHDLPRRAELLESAKAYPWVEV